MHAEKYFRPSANAQIPSEEVQQRILYECERAYAPVVWELPDDFDSFERFEQAVARLDWKSSPGYPYMQDAPTNRDWLKFNGVECDSIQMQQLWFDVKNVFSGDFETIFRVFIKQEPHKASKAVEGRWRLIMAAPLSVQIAWQMLFGYLNDLEIDKAYFIPSQQGMQMVGGNWKLYYNQWRQKGLTCGLDKSGWDWTCPSWVLMLDLVLRHRLGRGKRLREWKEIADRLYREAFVSSKIMFSSGLILKQCIPGIMKSGVVNTISTNSHGQMFVHIAVCLDSGLPLQPWPACCGDDTLQHLVHTNDTSVYQKYGLQIKEVSETMEFVGHEFTSSGPKPNYWMKHLKKMMYVKDEDLTSYLDSMAGMYVHTEQFEFWERLARILGRNLRLSRYGYLYWYDIEE